MYERVTKPQYLRIALDIAARIARGELEEGRKLYGRSVMASEYSVSPETIRRAFKVLADVNILEIKPQSCVVILSAQKAREYFARLEGSTDIHGLSMRLESMLAEQTAIGRKIADTVMEITKVDEKVTAYGPFINYEIQIPHNAPIVGKSLQELQFWHSTGATVIAIRRDKEILLSPGPYALLLEDDVVVFIGGTETVQAVTSFIKG